MTACSTTIELIVHGQFPEYTRSCPTSNVVFNDGALCAGNVRSVTEFIRGRKPVQLRLAAVWGGTPLLTHANTRRCPSSQSSAPDTSVRPTPPAWQCSGTTCSV